jgi:hypothetical protein
MARIKNFFFLLIFVIFFILGISIIKITFGNSSSSTNTPSTDSELGYQETFLVIGVDDLSQPQAILESAWLITIKSASSLIDFVPLYPDIIPPHDPILVSTTDYREYKNLEIIQKYKANWAGLILLDLTGLNMVVEVAGERLFQEPVYNNYDHLGLPRAWEVPVESLQKQENIVVFLCENSHPFFSYESIQYLMGFIPDHFRSNLSKDELWGKWQLLSNLNFNLTCHYSWQDNP